MIELVFAIINNVLDESFSVMKGIEKSNYVFDELISDFDPNKLKVIKDVYG